VTRREWKAARKAIWESMLGCTCRPLRKVGGKIVRVPRIDRCTKGTMRCEGRIRKWQRELDKLGPEPVPSSRDPKEGA
jgi:hypothetical protein